MPEKTIAAVFYTAQFDAEDGSYGAGTVFGQGETVDLDSREVERGDKLGAFTDSENLATQSVYDTGLTGTLGVNALADQATLDGLRAAIAAGDLERAKELVSPTVGTQESPSDDRLRSVVESGSADEVLGMVGNDPDLAEQAMAYEEQKDKPRTTLMAGLQRVIDAD
jgi:hypothetical protein